MPWRRPYYIKLSSLFASPKVIPCVVVYGCGIGFLLLSCISTAHSQGLHASSWTDGFKPPLIAISFIISMIGPLIAPCRARDRLLLLLFGFLGYLAMFGICVFIYTSLVSGQHASEIRMHALLGPSAFPFLG